VKTVNLLPKWYRQQRRQRRIVRMHVGAMLLLAAGMAGLWAAGQRQLRAVALERERLAATVAAMPDAQVELQRGQNDLRRLEDLQLAYRELGKTIPMSSVIQQIQNEMTPGMALAHLLIEVRPDPVKGSGTVGDARTPPRYHDVAYLSVEGVAPKDEDIARMIAKLAANPLFAEVTLDYSREGILNGFLVRRFEIKMKMDLERLTTQDPEMQNMASGGPVRGE
jgi:hypothetical protein